MGRKWGVEFFSKGEIIEKKIEVWVDIEEKIWILERFRVSYVIGYSLNYLVNLDELDRRLFM